ncbi:dihydrofolate reductase [Paenibacillus alvei]|uniref:dihydrofolate reductase n=1 Tax=Paenibacillus alvei TaxID=44250 RepID=UPI00227EEE7A|nr:dihydrofolate reductase [Paenibacillus alvei]MCY9737498.1 dihydrofolate reductase [Paenibacillus alvei]
MNISIIVAMDENGGIGKDNKLPWHLPEDLKRFKQITTGHAVAMGRKTFESIGKPLPNRTNIVLTRDNEFKAEGCFIAHTIEDAIRIAKSSGAQELFCIGGANVYDQFLSIADYIYVTQVVGTFDVDTYFIERPFKEKVESMSFEEVFPDEKNMYRMRFFKLCIKRDIY